MFRGNILCRRSRNLIRWGSRHAGSAVHQTQDPTVSEANSAHLSGIRHTQSRSRLFVIAMLVMRDVLKHYKPRWHTTCASEGVDVVDKSGHPSSKRKILSNAALLCFVRSYHQLNPHPLKIPNQCQTHLLTTRESRSFQSCSSSGRSWGLGALLSHRQSLKLI